MNHRKMRRSIIAAHCLLAAGLAVMLTDALGITDVRPIIVNPTDSMPRGFYIRTFQVPARGTIVFLPLPPVMHDYMTIVSPDWAAWFDRPGHGLLKPVVAVAGDDICRLPPGDVFTAAGVSIGPAATTGLTGVALPSWQGCRRLQDGEIAVGSSRVEDSLDSRYTGAADASKARTYSPIWTWE